ncbi:MAG: hypothetical protein ACKOPE_08395 [Novosphingobium sp.]
MSYFSVNIGTAAQSGWIDSQMIGAGIQSVAVVAAGWFGFRAITKQIRESESRRLKSQLLEQSLESARNLSGAASEAKSILIRLVLEVDVHSKAAAAGIDSPIPTIRFPAIMEMYQNFSNAALNLIFLVESRQFIEPRCSYSVMHC